ncbi:hypothetical protein PWG14_03255 (plasmid) [Chromobacterium amazonense]|nr:hypothetical protein [Chromobacterium amazonense]MDE1711790.1 hypothetical protein [Chromobacterium amazonense]
MKQTPRQRGLFWAPPLRQSAYVHGRNHNILIDGKLLSHILNKKPGGAW